MSRTAATGRAPLYVEAPAAYTIRRTAEAPDLAAGWDDPVWSAAETLHVASFHAKSSDHRPRTRARALYDQDGLYVMFDVQDRYVICRPREYQGRVSLDSCVEFFVQPRPAAGYIALEMNCGGAMFLHYIEDPTRTPVAFFKKATAVPPELGRLVRVVSSLPPALPAEIAGELHWRIALFMPFALIEEYVGPIGRPAGQAWRGNFFKCADESSHPHWASWSSIGQVLRFHRPQCFGTLRFEAE